MTSRPLVVAIVPATKASSTIDSGLSFSTSSMSSSSSIAGTLGSGKELGKPCPAFCFRCERTGVGRARRRQVDQGDRRLGAEQGAPDPGRSAAVEADRLDIRIIGEDLRDRIVA